jgi:hypothetical protein
MKPEPNHSGIVKVGEGRGFVVQAKRDRLVITAAHCLPKLPPYCSFDSEGDTYAWLIGPVGGQPEIWAECLFIDPVGDIAVLGPVDDQELFEQTQAYEEMVHAVTPFRIADAPLRGSAWLYSLDEHWFQCHVWRLPGGPLWLSEATEGIKGGMSGSPVRNEEGRAIGVVSASSGGSDLEDHREGGPNPALTRNLPGWLLREM